MITTVIHKFRAALGKRRIVDQSADIFVLVDESHRSQYGDLESLRLLDAPGFPAPAREPKTLVLQGLGVAVGILA